MHLKTKTALTFIEVLLVAAIIGTLIGVSLPYFRKTSNTLTLRSFAKDLQSVMNYLEQRAVVSGKIITLNINNAQKKYWARIDDEESLLNSGRIPEGIRISPAEQLVLFYPDGKIDPITLTLVNSDNQEITLTTKGVFGKVKIKM